MNDNSFLYFAYGSNMGRRRLGHPDRAPSAQFVAKGYVLGRRLTFDKVSTDGSGKCDCERASPDDRVWGALYLIGKQDRKRLDKAEAVGYGYEAQTVTVVTSDGPREALTYVATNKASGLKPYGWYKHHVIAGAEAIALPSEYIALIRAVEEEVDEDRERHAKEMSVYIR